jgi:murein DD-endopeptidase MepM/ murein hydrolase activator NlpD
MMDKYLTFLYVRRGNAGVKSIRIHRTLAISVCAAVIGLVALSVFLVATYSRAAMDYSTVVELRQQNAELTERIATLQQEIGDLDRRMDSNLELHNRARLLAGLEPITEDVWQVGVGGPEPELIDFQAGRSGALVFSLEKDLEQMVRQSELQLESYSEILGILEKEKQVRDTTPSIRPVKGGYLSSRFGRRMNPFTGRIARHVGVDYRARTGTPVMSTADGVVTMSKKKGSFGLVIEVNHGNGFKTRYAHLSKILVKRGKRVKRGEIIGLVGNSGRSTGSHLHYEVIFRKVHRNPLHYVIPEDAYYD